jgi:hypothetical protein
MVLFVFLDFGTVPTVLYYFFSGIWSCSNSVVLFVFLDFAAVPTMWYYLLF